MRRHTAGGVRRAFTFLEIMVVVIIIGLLVSMGGVMWMDKLKKAKKNICEAKIKGTLRTEIETYKSFNNRYPTTDEGWKALADGDANIALDDMVMDPWGIEFHYKCPGENGRAYDIWSSGPNQEDEQGGGDDITNWKKATEE